LVRGEGVAQQDDQCHPGESLHLPGLPKNFLRPCLLLLLGEEAAYGYELRDKLAPLSASPWDQGTVYRTLNTMEDDGVVASSWERSAEGPRRRRYRITREGRLVLDQLARELSGVRNLIAGFLERYQHDLFARVSTTVAEPEVGVPAAAALVAEAPPAAAVAAGQLSS
jgi:poly-beta-hydroxybutyrate-responsive repressor